MRRWLRMWRNEPIKLRTPLPIDVVRARLKTGSTSLASLFLNRTGGGFTVLARVRKRRLFAMAQCPPSQSRTWATVLRGRLEPDGEGTRLVGSLGLGRLVKIYAVLLLVAFGVAVGGVVLGRYPGTVAVVAVAVAVFLVAGTIWAEREARPSVVYLRDWLIDRLDADLPGRLRFVRPSPGSPS